MKKIIICADDYAQNEAISEGIRRLIEARRINAVSCLTNSPLWPQAGEALKACHSACSIGLHLNFTWGSPQSARWQERHGPTFSTLLSLLIANYSRRLNQAAIKAECKAQLEAFRQVMGRDPDFIDGHQHVHQWPQIRASLIELYQEEQLSAWLRISISRNVSYACLMSKIKSQMIACLGGYALKYKLDVLGIPRNTSFAGVYPFEHVASYRNYVQRFLAASEDGGLIMCHPGLALDAPDPDPIQASRPQEFAYFMSDAFNEDLQRYGCRLSESVSENNQ